MKKRILSLALSLSLAVSLFVPAFAAEDATQPVTPTAPEWINEEDYLIFPGDEVYLPENWAEIEELREQARSGKAVLRDANGTELSRRDTDGSIGRKYEVALAWLKCAENAKLTTATAHNDFYAAGRAFDAAADDWRDAHDNEEDEIFYRLELLAIRAHLLRDQKPEQFLLYWRKVTARTVFYLGMHFEDIYDAPHMELVPKETRYAVFEAAYEYLSDDLGYPFPSADVEPSPDGSIQIFLEDYYLKTDVPAVITNGRTMIPIRAVAEALGVEVGWEDSTRQITLTQAGTTIVMTIDSMDALVNDKTVTMDVAPYISEGRTLLPVRYVAEFFGQKVEWEESTRRVFISEDKSAVGDSNLEDWAVHMSMIYGSRAAGDQYGKPGFRGVPIYFGMYDRTASQVQTTRSGLVSNWGVSKREDVFRLVPSMTYHGHNDDFQEAAAVANNLTDEEFAALIAMSGATDKYMWSYTKEISERWGDKGILAWDLSRMGAMVQWGYNAGYLTYEEALELIEPAARLTQETFSSWHEFYLNYLDGYSWWARNNIYTARETYEEELKAECGGTLPETYETWMALPRAEDYQRIIDFLDDSLFETGVIGLPEE